MKTISINDDTKNVNGHASNIDVDHFGNIHDQKQPNPAGMNEHSQRQHQIREFVKP